MRTTCLSAASYEVAEPRSSHPSIFDDVSLLIPGSVQAIAFTSPMSGHVFLFSTMLCVTGTFSHFPSRAASIRVSRSWGGTRPRFSLCVQNNRKTIFALAKNTLRHVTETAIGPVSRRATLFVEAGCQLLRVQPIASAADVAAREDNMLIPSRPGLPGPY